MDRIKRISGKRLSNNFYHLSKKIDDFNLKENYYLKTNGMIFDNDFKLKYVITCETERKIVVNNLFGKVKK